MPDLEHAHLRTAGAACAACGTGTTCASGKCVCNGTSCGGGCCNGTTCVAYSSESNTLCGTGGATCAPCASVRPAAPPTGAAAQPARGPAPGAAARRRRAARSPATWFGQGTKAGTGCTGNKTYCGYCGTESGSNNGGTCPTGITDTVPNTGTQYFAAFPVGSFGQGTYCGMCVDVTWMGKTITATIVDECGTCPTSSHIDLSLSAAVALGLGQGDDHRRSQDRRDLEGGRLPGHRQHRRRVQRLVAADLLPERDLPGGQGGRGRAHRHPGVRLLGLRRGSRGMSVTLTDSRRPRRDGTIPSSSGGSRRHAVPDDVSVILSGVERRGDPPFAGLIHPPRRCSATPSRRKASSCVAAS